jgi:hypothetical protein
MKHFYIVKRKNESIEENYPYHCFEQYDHATDCLGDVLTDLYYEDPVSFEQEHEFDNWEIVTISEPMLHVVTRQNASNN